MASSPALPARFIALDIRSNAVMIGAVDAHQHAVREDDTWRTTFVALEQRAGRDRASVATARKLLLLVWETLTAYIAVDDQQVRQVAA